MRAWTVQPLAVWEALLRRRVLRVCPEMQGLLRTSCNKYVPRAYHWLQEQLGERLDNYQGHLPWWSYCRRPDIRQYRHVVPRETVAVRLELELSKESLVRFPCWAWHRVL